MTQPRSLAPARSTPSTRSPAAVLWDFDGTLVDTEPVWMRAQFDLVAELGGRWSDEHCHAMVGNALLDSGRYLLRVLGRSDLTPEWVVEQLVQRVLAVIRTADIPWRPGARELLASLDADGVPCALVSASYRALLDAILDRLPHHPFQVVVAGDAVTHGKPHPEPYLTGCARLQVAPQDCLVVEDSVTGADSGNAAGCVVLAVRNLVAVPPRPRRVLLGTLEGVDADRLGELYRGAAGAP